MRISLQDHWRKSTLHKTFIDQSLTIQFAGGKQANFLAEHGQCGRQ
jgi:hypothetical protein